MVRVGNQGRSGTTARIVRVIAVALCAVPLLMSSNYTALGTPPPADIDQARNMTGTQPNAGERSHASAWDPRLVTMTAGAPEQPAAAPERAPSANPLWEIPLATLSSTRERPIFSSSRRPLSPGVAAAVANAPPSPPEPVKAERPQLWLVGTIVGGDQSFGIFVDQTTKAALRLKIGEEAQGWNLRSVNGREVMLEREQQTVILSLPEPGAGAAWLARVQAANAGILQGPADLQSVLRELDGRR